MSHATFLRLVFFALSVAIFLTKPAVAVEITKVTSSNLAAVVSHGQAHQWALDEFACVLMPPEPSICGQIVVVTPKGAILRFASPAPVSVGLMAVPMSQRPEKFPETLAPDMDLEMELIPIYRELTNNAASLDPDFEGTGLDMSFQSKSFRLRPESSRR